MLAKYDALCIAKLNVIKDICYTVMEQVSAAESIDKANGPHTALLGAIGECIKLKDLVNATEDTQIPDNF